MVTRRSDGFVLPCIQPPPGVDWVHEIKHDGYACRSGAPGTRCACSPDAATIGALAIRRSPAPRSMCGPGHSRSTARRSSAGRMASRSSTRCAARGPSAMPCSFDLLKPAGDLRSLQGAVDKAGRPAPGGDRSERAHRRGRRHHFPAGLQDGSRQRCVEPALGAMPLRPVAGVDQVKNPDRPAMIRARDVDW
jgi:hypothetical protein